MYLSLLLHLGFEFVPSWLVDVEVPCLLVVIQLLPGLEEAFEGVRNDGAQLHPFGGECAFLRVQYKLYI